MNCARGPRAGLHARRAAARAAARSCSSSRSRRERVAGTATAIVLATRRGPPAPLRRSSSSDDAAGRALAARFELPAAERMRIVVDDARRACTRSSIDPLLTAVADTLLRADQDRRELGVQRGLGGRRERRRLRRRDRRRPALRRGPDRRGRGVRVPRQRRGIGERRPATADAQLEANQATLRLRLQRRVGRRRERRRLRRRDRRRAGYDAGQSDEGAAFVFLGGAAGIADGEPGDGRTRSSSPNQAIAQLWLQRRRRRRRERRRLRRRDRRAPSSTTPARATRARPSCSSAAPAGIADGDAGHARDAQLEANQASAQLGCSVAAAGDVNGDGYADVIVGAALRRRQADEGAAFVFLGSAVGHRERQPRARRTRSSSRTRPARSSAASVGAARRRERRRLRRRDRRRARLRRRPDRRGRGLRVPRQRGGRRRRQPRDGARAARVRTRRRASWAAPSRPRAT